MKKLLITGFSGFVARHYLDYLFANQCEYQVWGVDIKPPLFSFTQYESVLQIQFHEMNLLDEKAVYQSIQEFQPDEILHLAAFSSVSYSWQHPAECVKNNTACFLNISEAVRQYCPKCRILSVGSSEIYGNVEESQLPLREDMITHPVNPYAAARQLQETMAAIYVDSYGLDIILTRSFNHFGPGQDERFVIPSFVKRIKEVKESGQESGKIETGDTTIIRDFLDVRDVVRAYYMLLQQGSAGEVYNICGGRGISLRDIITEIAKIQTIEISTRVNPEYVRPDDNRVIIGSYDKIKKEIGWEPEIELGRTLRDMV